MAGKENPDFVTQSAEPAVDANGALTCRQAMTVTGPPSPSLAYKLLDAVTSGFTTTSVPVTDGSRHLDSTFRCGTTINADGSMSNPNGFNFRGCAFQSSGYTAGELPFCALECSKKSAAASDGTGNTGTQSA